MLFATLKYFVRCGLFDKTSVEKMLRYENSGFPLDAKVRIQPWDRDWLERLIRYCARPPFASENLRMNGHLQVYRFPNPTHKGQTFIQLDLLEFLKRIAAFIPHPRRHRHQYHGAFARNSPLKKKVSASAGHRLDEISPASVKNAMDKVR
ncbi:MAG: transposase [Parachlamydiaceae bacterium]|nr:transposase [Parachlamydiaceae bacterium]